ncbi:hypothetical protein L2E82_51078 [Cichorium intybus]|nr:hypothetical protein L2E82_51078 [Cichorium intybus]
MKLASMMDGLGLLFLQGARRKLNLRLSTKKRNRCNTKWARHLFHYCKYRRDENQLYVFSDDSALRWLAAACHIDFDTMTGVVECEIQVKAYRDESSPYAAMLATLVVSERCKYNIRPVICGDNMYNIVEEDDFVKKENLIFVLYWLFNYDVIVQAHLLDLYAKVWMLELCKDGR